MPSAVSVLRRCSLVYAFDTLSPLNFEEHSVPADSFNPHDLEAAFFQDSFWCCGKPLSDLHDLLLHHEDYHAHEFELDFTEDEPGQDLKRKRSLFEQQFSFAAKRLALADKDEAAEIEEKVHPEGDEGDDRQIPWELAVMASQLVASLREAPLSEVEEALFQREELGDDADRPFKCPVPGCDKAYKNHNGLKYHHQRGNCNLNASGMEDVNRPYRCSVSQCGKRYKNLNGLKYHIEKCHLQSVPVLRPTQAMTLN
ncbi:uncharacterized protein VTP21DRAFT_3750 [Calcarisporiella thermophila]|uniref:uncharacterized protein n=1 Tax=Calcarisporiella thermophila TaxID=911321 RepID=UPI00374434D0